MVLKAKRLKVSYSGSQSLSQNEKDEQPKLFVLPARLLLFLIIHLYEKEAEWRSFCGRHSLGLEIWFFNYSRVNT